MDADDAAGPLGRRIGVRSSEAIDMLRRPVPVPRGPHQHARTHNLGPARVVPRKIAAPGSGRARRFSTARGKVLREEALAYQDKTTASWPVALPVGARGTSGLATRRFMRAMTGRSQSLASDPEQCTRASRQKPTRNPRQGSTDKAGDRVRVRSAAPEVSW